MLSSQNKRYNFLQDVLTVNEEVANLNLIVQP